MQLHTRVYTYLYTNVHTAFTQIKCILHLLILQVAIVRDRGVCMCVSATAVL